jgi:hypothetical protein
MKIIFAGVIAREPLGGPTWVWLQYLLGFRRLGHDVYFLEESGEWPYVYDFTAMEESADPALGAAYIRRFLEPYGLGESWVYRAGGICLGMEGEELLALCREADVLIALPTSIWSWRPEYDAIPLRVLLDVDPGFTQLRAAAGDELIGAAIAHCNRFCTYGPRIDNTSLPDLGKRWIATRPPIVLDEWPACYGAGAAAPFTTVMQWSSDPSPEYQGQVLGQKDIEFERIIDLPVRTSQPLEVALSGGPAERLEGWGWQVVPGWDVSRDPDAYRRYVQNARAELSVAKNGYVTTGCGWISDRTICFLASARPALVQETGLSRWLPTGEGLITFRTAEEALAGIERINAEYERHQRAARMLAETYFDSDEVLARFLLEVGENQGEQSR